jgi:hypothetical protein
MNVRSALLAQFKDLPACARAVEAVSESPAEQELAEVEPIVSAALLVSSAFRMRDEAGLIATLRLLTSAVAAWETRQLEPANDA